MCAFDYFVQHTFQPQALQDGCTWQGNKAALSDFFCNVRFFYGSSFLNFIFSFKAITFYEAYTIFKM